MTYSWKQVFAWRMRRVHLSRRVSSKKLVQTVSDICGAHAQIMSTVGLALTARVTGLKQAHLDQAIGEDRSLVKTWAMRGTLHVFAADDLPLYAAAQRTRDQYMNPAFLKYFGLEVADVKSVLDAIPQALDGKALTREELSNEILRITKRSHLEERLRSGWGELLKPAAFRGLLCFAPQEGRTVIFVRPDQWIGRWRDIGTDEALKESFRRFLSAYGPANTKEVARWLGVKPGEARRVLNLMIDELDEVDVEGVRRWILSADVRALRRAEPVTGVRLLPSFDQVLVMAAPHKEGFVDLEFAHKIYRDRIAVWSLPAMAIDGRVSGAWKLERKTKRAVLNIEPFKKKLSTNHQTQLEEEAARISTLIGMPVEMKLAT